LQSPSGFPPKHFLFPLVESTTPVLTKVGELFPSTPRRNKLSKSPARRYTPFSSACRGEVFSSLLETPPGIGPRKRNSAGTAASKALHLSFCGEGPLSQLFPLSLSLLLFQRGTLYAVTPLRKSYFATCRFVFSFLHSFFVPPFPSF